MERRTRRSDTRGFAAITALLVVLVVGVFIMGSLVTAQIGTFVARNDVQATQAQYVATAGMQAYRTALFQNYRWLIDGGAAGGTTVGSCGVDFGSTAVVDLHRVGASSALPWSVGQRLELASDVPVRDAHGEVVGSYDVSILKDSDTRFVVEAVGTSGTATATARAALAIGDAGVLEQAIFSGDGSNAKSINGSIKVRGGIYIEGQEGDPKPVVLTAGGNFSQHNHYDMSSYGSELEARVDPAYRRADDLCATLRVENGKIELKSGSVGLGENDVGGGIKARLQGVFVDGGSADIIAKNFYDQQTDEYSCKNNGGVCADDVGAFDLDRATAPDFPELDGPPAPGSECSLATWRACIDAKAAPDDGGITIRSSDLTGFPQSCQQALRNPPTLTLGAGNIDCRKDGYGFYYNGATKRLEVYGTVKLEGFDLVAQGDLRYVAAERDVEFPANKNASLVLVDDGTGNGGSVDFQGELVPDTTMGEGWTFPSQVLGIVAEEDVTFTKRTNVMAPVYAGGEFRITHQSQLFGSVIAESFCTTGAGKDKCNAGQSVELVHISTRHNRPDALGFIEPGVPRATFLSLSVEVN